MDTRDGHLISQEAFDSLIGLEKKHFKAVKRDLTEKERMEKQIKLYSPCGCGSGNKFKFCCYVGKQMEDFMFSIK
ncbi:MAG: hypothetical protein NUV80_01245 [Candidatus Berkelbacteria bacterium]|nr:hypothetical protein [Candidatus Berkelbacteria bacterium]